MLAKTEAVRYGVTAAPLTAVKPRSYVQDKSLLMVLGGVAAVLILVFGMYFLRITLDNQRLKVQQVRENVVQLTAENEVLQLKVNQLKSLQRIQVIAETELGMMIPTAAVYSSAAANRR